MIFIHEVYSPDIMLFRGNPFANPDSIAYICIAPMTGTWKRPIDIPKIQSEIAVDIGVALRIGCRKGAGPINEKLAKIKICPIIMA